MTLTPAFIALEPEARLHHAIAAAKQAVRSTVGSQRYLDDPPHLTLQVGWFPDLTQVDAVVARCAATLIAPTVEVSGWQVFRDDPLTGGHTVVTAMTSDSQETLRHIQQQMLTTVAPLRDAAASQARYLPAWDRLTPLRQASVERWGFPFTGADWSPHVSVASIAPAAWDAVWPALGPLAPLGRYRFSHLVLYRLDDQQIATRLSEYPLATR